MSVSAQDLLAFRPSREGFVGLDSDGCVFDHLTRKHREAFAPAFIRHFGLETIAPAALEVWEFVNLHSRTRGIPRFAALSNALNLLAERPEVAEASVRLWSTDALDLWLAHEPAPTPAALAATVRAGAPELRRALDWSDAVEAALARLGPAPPPFPAARTALARLASSVDALVLGDTPVAELQRDWAQHGLAGHVQLIAGCEAGRRSEQLRCAAAGKYPPSHILLIGDAPPDFRAARAHYALFYPIVPGYEDLSWQRLHAEALDHFLGGTYAGAYEDAVLAEFHASLPEAPPWRP